MANGRELCLGVYKVSKESKVERNQKVYWIKSKKKQQVASQGRYYIQNKRKRRKKQ